MQGLVLIDKPRQWTSFDVVNYIRKMVATAEGKKPKNVKVGHTGTLDPLATGLLVILVGKEYTRRAQEWSKLDKVYEVTMKLGETSTTGDDEGDKTALSTLQPSEANLRTALAKFTGTIMQTPPIYSAMKVNGQRAYKLAREGKPVALEPRPATISALTLTGYDYPMVYFTCTVSSGTYIRSLVQDIGAELGSGAYMPALRRTAVGQFELANAVPPEALELSKIQPMD